MDELLGFGNLKVLRTLSQHLILTLLCKYLLVYLKKANKISLIKVKSHMRYPRVKIKTFLSSR